MQILFKGQITRLYQEGHAIIYTNTTQDMYGHTHITFVRAHKMMWCIIWERGFQFPAFFHCGLASIWRQQDCETHFVCVCLCVCISVCVCGCTCICTWGLSDLTHEILMAWIRIIMLTWQLAIISPSKNQCDIITVPHHIAPFPSLYNLSDLCISKERNVMFSRGDRSILSAAECPEFHRAHPDH